ncbi:flagellar biosynthesis protein FlgA [Streptomyces kaniharaensis]|uniref:Flagellar biosynthesis protein FlgA n=1 Tax=Streptomyces kaniharaensis TaxID=212423 RepID=A0A6N7L5K6_9ACTN|nr:SAF domain-containing protein [Streptomyces kaniharaensis]MQS17283.1 flagellar biosynthesis protein FlgA [Streptomyces kaniharaensis]
MSTTTGPAPETTDQQTPAPKSIVRQPVVRRRRPGFIAMAVALIAVGVGANAWLYMSTGNREPVVAIAHDVPMGAQLTADDLVEARIATDPVLTPVPASQLKKMIGKRTTVGLTKGSLLTTQSVTDQPLIKQGQSLVGVSLSPAQIPASQLSPGQKVNVIHTPKNNAAAATDGASGSNKNTTVQAVVIEVGKADNSGDRVVDLAANTLDGATLAQWSANGEASLVVVPSGS